MSKREGSEFESGTPGASARREHQRRQAGREARTRRRHRRIGGLLLAFQGAPAHETAWVRGAEGEERVARRLAKLLGSGVVLLHDRRIPGGRTNVDHLAVAPSGIWVIDTKRYRGKVSVVNPLFGDARLTIGGRDKSGLAEALGRQVAVIRSAVAESGFDVPVQGALCFVDAELPLLGGRRFRGFPLAYPRGLARRIKAGRGLSPEQVRTIAGYLASRFPAA